MDDLAALFADNPASSWDEQMRKLIFDPRVSQVVINRHDRIFYTRDGSTLTMPNVFPGPEQYIDWLNTLMALTDVGYKDLRDARVPVIEGSFDPRKVPSIHGSIHITTRDITRGEPGLTIRKQPVDIITLDQMVNAQMMSPEMCMFLENSMRGRSNILISGGSGAGKTTLARALSNYIDPNHRVITCEEIDELHLYDRLPNVMSLTAYRNIDETGRIVSEFTLDNLVREGLRMRCDRIWVGETRGKEAYALVKACNSGHDGSVTTLHADNAKTAVKQATTYVMESGVPEEVARDQVCRAFHLVIQISKVQMGRRVISEISEVESVSEGREVRTNPLWKYDASKMRFDRVGSPTPLLQEAWARYGVSWADMHVSSPTVRR